MNKKVLRWNFVFQYGWVITNIINSLLLFPIYITYIDKDTLGLWVATSSILSWMTLVDPGVGEVLQQKIAEMRGALQYRLDNKVQASATELADERNEIGRSIGSGLTASAIILALSIIVGLVCFFSAGTLINKSIDQYPHLSVALLITVISTGMQLVSFTVSGINQGLHNSAHVAIASLTANVVFLIVNLFFLYGGLGVLSIALANLIRSLYINTFNFTSLLSLLKREETTIRYQKQHFKKFIRIFSFTSASKIISGLAGGMDMLVLARFIAPSQITLYELNRRPVAQANSLIGRHSVALMPSISHAKGTGDRQFIINLIHKQFKLYIYFVLFATFMFIINYKDFLIVWTRQTETFMGYQILLLIVFSSATGLLGYFMSNMNYALGDIKSNSKFSMIRNLIYGVLVVIGAKLYGILGTLYIGFGMSVLGDFLFFSYRNFKMNYLDKNWFQRIMIASLITAAVSGVICFGGLYLLNTFIPESMHISKLIIGSSFFTLFYIIYVLTTDKEVRSLAVALKNKVAYSPLLQKMRIGTRNHSTS